MSPPRPAARTIDLRCRRNSSRHGWQTLSSSACPARQVP